MVDNISAQFALNKIHIRISEMNSFLDSDLMNVKSFAKLSSIVMDATKAIGVM